MLVKMKNLSCLLSILFAVLVIACHQGHRIDRKTKNTIDSLIYFDILPATSREQINDLVNTNGGISMNDFFKISNYGVLIDVDTLDEDLQPLMFQYFHEIFSPFPAINIYDININSIEKYPFLGIKNGGCEMIYISLFFDSTSADGKLIRCPKPLPNRINPFGKISKSSKDLINQVLTHYNSEFRAVDITGNGFFKVAPVDSSLRYYLFLTMEQSYYLYRDSSFTVSWEQYPEPFPFLNN